MTIDTKGSGSNDWETNVARPFALPLPEDLAKLLFFLDEDGKPSAVSRTKTGTVKINLALPEDYKYKVGGKIADDVNTGAGNLNINDESVYWRRQLDEPLRYYNKAKHEANDGWRDRIISLIDAGQNPVDIANVIAKEIHADLVTKYIKVMNEAAQSSQNQAAVTAKIIRRELEARYNNILEVYEEFWKQHHFLPEQKKPSDMPQRVLDQALKEIEGLTLGVGAETPPNLTGAAFEKRSDGEKADLIFKTYRQKAEELIKTIGEQAEIIYRQRLTHLLKTKVEAAKAANQVADWLAFKAQPFIPPPRYEPPPYQKAIVKEALKSWTKLTGIHFDVRETGGGRPLHKQADIDVFAYAVSSGENQLSAAMVTPPETTARGNFVRRFMKYAPRKYMEDYPLGSNEWGYGLQGHSARGKPPG